MDRSAALRPLSEAAGPIRLLEEYRSDAELNAAVREVALAVEQALRLALRTDLAAPEDHRLSALSPNAMPLEEVVRSLRSRDLLSIETAGGLHELAAAGRRATDGEARPADADAAASALARLRADLARLGDADELPDAPAPAAPGDAPTHASSPAPPSRPPARIRGGGRWMAWLGTALALLFVIGFAWVLASGGEDEFRAGVAAFRAERWDSAAVAFERVLENRPVDVNARLYLSRVYRRQGRLQAASEVLREAVRVAPRDADVRRELGHLFMDLEQPESAIQQYERALEHDPDSELSWAGLIRALRAAGDPRAERLLERAPPSVRESLGADRRG
jgi:tetratricopeptide (TPR) repeat protein